MKIASNIVLWGLNFMIVTSNEALLEHNLLLKGLELSDIFITNHNKLLENISTKNLRQKRAYWGLDKMFNDAVKAKDHFGKLKQRFDQYMEDQMQVIL